MIITDTEWQEYQQLKKDIPSYDRFIAYCYMQIKDISPYANRAEAKECKFMDLRVREEMAARK